MIDKTGTLTEGKPKVVGIIPAEGVEEDELLRLAASVERGSEHPLARAILEAAVERRLDLGPVGDFASPSGKGATGTVDGKSIALGNAALMAELNVATNALDDAAEAARQQGATAIYRRDRRPRGRRHRDRRSDQTIGTSQRWRRCVAMACAS